MLTVDEELAMEDSLHRQGLAAAPKDRSGMVLVVALVAHKDGPPPQGPDLRVKHLPGQQYWMERDRAERAQAAGIVYQIGHSNVDWFGGRGRVLSPWPDEEMVHTRQAQPDSLRIVQGCGYDPGSQAYRLHSAFNQCTKHASTFVRWGDSNPHSSFRQYDGERDASVVRQAILEADVLHCHMNYMLLNNAGLSRQAGQLLVRHYHGSLWGGGTLVQGDVDVARGALLMGARLSFYRDADLVRRKFKIDLEIHWLPITVPVWRYRRLPKRAPDGEFWVAHAPTKRSYKGTEQFVRAVRALQAKGLPIRGVLIEGKGQAEALELKARCDATFDSFWLGIQTSGLEGAAMQQPVIAGDEDVAALYREHVGYVPYTYANDEPSLTAQLERLVVDERYRQAEADRVARYCVEYHDYNAVAHRYEVILARRLKRPEIETVSPEWAQAAGR